MMLVAVGGVWLLLSPTATTPRRPRPSVRPRDTRSTRTRAVALVTAEDEPRPRRPRSRRPRRPGRRGRRGDRHRAAHGPAERRRVRQPDDVRRREHARRPPRHLLADGRRRHGRRAHLPARRADDADPGRADQRLRQERRRRRPQPQLVRRQPPRPLRAVGLRRRHDRRPAARLDQADADHRPRRAGHHDRHLRLVAVSSPGTGRSARDYTAVSEVSLVGRPRPDQPAQAGGRPELASTSAARLVSAG